jgi:amino acid adenylation domain-containing protein
MNVHRTSPASHPAGQDLSDAAHLGAAFAATAARHAEQPALRYDQDTVTYAQLAARVRDVAHLMATSLTATPPHQELPAGGRPAPDAPAVIAVLLEASPGFVVAVLAAVTVGAAYLPIDVQVPDAYLHTVLADANPRIVVTSAAHAGRLPSTVPVVLLENLLRAGQAGAAARAWPAPGPQDAAYVIYTSGSTGQPKGVLVSHAAMLNSTAARMDAYGVPHRMPLLHSVAFDLSSGVLFWALLGGGTLIPTSTPLRDVAGTLTLIREERVTHLVYPASLYASLLERAADDPPVGLRTVMIGSERWSPAVIDRHAALLPGTSLFNEYGPTEACVWTSAGHVYDAATRTTAPMSIGQPIRNTTYEVRTTDGEPVTDGQPGELWISGNNVAIGYLHRPDLTGQRFVTRPDGSRVYRTGDLAWVDEHGNYVFAGRIDRQLKVGGNRIEAGHVETVLMTHPDIEQAHVTAGPDGSDGSATVDGGVLIAYLVHRAGAAPVGPAELAAHVAASVPAYMVPSMFVPLVEFPRTLNGKVDEARLPAPTAAPRADVLDAGNPTEQTIAAAAAAILGVAAVDRERPLTDLGASSLALVRLAAAVHRDFGVDVPISVLFGQPTITAVARAVATATPSDRPVLHAGAHPGGGGPLSGQQRQMWVLQQLAPHALAYHTLFSLQLTGPLDIAVLREALHRIIARHEMLRTTFHDDTATGTHQVVHSAWPVDLDVVDLTGVPYPDRVRTLAEAIAGQGAIGFDPGRLPLLRWHLYRLGPTQWRLLQVEHHLVHDGWSASLFLAEIRDTYHALLHGGELPGPLPVQYRDYADWYQRWRGSADHAAQLAFWRDILHGAPSDPATFHPDRPRPSVHRYTGGCLTATIPAATLALIDARCAAHRVSRFAALLSAFYLLAWQHTAETDLVIGSAFANRRHHATAELLGMFVNALPLRLHVDPAADLISLVSATMRMLLDAQDHQELPLLDLLDGLDVARDPARNPLFQLMFAFHDSPRPDFRVPSPAGDLHGELIIEHNGSAKNDANIVCVPNPARPGTGLRHDGMQVRWEYDSDLFDQATAQRLLDGFLHLVQEFTGPWDRAVAEVDLLGHAQRYRIVQAGTGPSVPVPYPTLHAGVDAAIDRHRDHVAVEHGDTRWTYADLDAHTVAAEHALAHVWVGVGGIVAVTIPPSAALVAACLAVLRRGGAYVCLDTTQPAARLRQLCADAAPCAVLGTADTLTALPDLGVPVIDVNALTPGSGPAPTRPRHDAGRPVYLVYTSGSTGTPKAVVATHTNAVTAVHARTVRCGARPPRTLVTLPAIFDVAGSMTFWTLWRGGTLILPAPGDDIRDPATVRALISRHAVTHVNFVSSFYQALLDNIPGHDSDPPHPDPGSSAWGRSLRVVAIGGEPCTPHLLRRHTAVLPAVTLLNEYGPTEATVWCTAAIVHIPTPDPSSHALVGRVTVGTPLPNTTVFVVHSDLGSDLRLAPLGAVGELVVGGAGVTAGYLRDDALTRHRFVTPIRGPLAGQRLYRTGDRGRLTPDGQFEILGRLDDQVKIRGYRVELGEVERCLREHPDIADVAVTLDRADGDGASGALAAYLVSAADPNRDQTRLPGDLRAWVAQRLPGYMVPNRVLALPVLPRTSTGKLDRARLPHSDWSPAALADDAPLTPAEARLRDLWRQLLGHAPASCDDDFFAAGGDSLQAIRLAAAAKAAGLPLTVEQVLAHRTIRAQAALADRTAATGPGQRGPRRPAGTRLALTPIQAWFFAHDFADPDHFNQARVFDVDPSVPTPTIAAAVARTLARHDAFRTRFVPGADGWHGVLDDHADTALPELTLSSPPDTAEQDVDQNPEPGADPTDADPVAEQLRRRLDAMHRSLRLDGGPLFAFVLAHHPNTAQRWLLAVVHHLLIDAVSWEILRTDLETALRSATTDTATSTTDPAAGLPTFPGPGADIDPAAQRWWRHLAAAPKPVLTQPTGSIGPAASVGQLARRTWRLSAHATRYLTVDGPRLTHSTTRSLLLAALARTLHPLANRPTPPDPPGRPDAGGFYVYVERHGRNGVAHAEQVIGWCTDLHPVLLDTGNDGPLAALAADIEAHLAAAPADDSYARARYLHPGSPLGTLLTQMRAPDVTFNYLGTTTSPDGHLVGAAAMPAGQPIGARNVLPTPLDVSIAVTAGTMAATYAYDPGRFDPGAIDAAGDRFAALLEQAARTVALHTGQNRRGARPHFLIHPVGGSIDAYTPLARRLAPDQECYGITDDGSGDTVVEFAAYYYQRIRAVQPQGPYTITGWSFGAAIAFEIGRLLDAEPDADTPYRITLLDPPDPTGPHHDPAVLARHLHAILPDQPAALLHDAAQDTDGLPPAGRAERLLTLLRVHLLPAGNRGPVAQRIERLVGHHAALAGWAATGTVHALQIVQSAEHHATGSDPTRWQPHSRTPLQVAVVPGTHTTVLTVGLDVLVSRLHPAHATDVLAAAAGAAAPDGA